MPSAHTDVAASDASRSHPRAPGTAEPADRAGRAAEPLVERRVRAALPERDGYRVFANVAWTGRTTTHGQLTDGEADFATSDGLVPSGGPAE